MGDLFPFIGMALQWARHQPKFAEVYYIGIVAACSILFTWYGDPHLWSGGFAGWVDAVKPNVVNILAMTQITSSGSNVLASTPLGRALGPKTAALVMPQTKLST